MIFFCLIDLGSRGGRQDQAIASVLLILGQQVNEQHIKNVRKAIGTLSHRLGFQEGARTRKSSLFFYFWVNKSMKNINTSTPKQRKTPGAQEHM